MEHKKLVRDLIPQLIEADGNDAVTRVLEQEEYFQALKDKLMEVVEEYMESEDPEELADILEIIRALLEMHVITYDELEIIRHQKLEENGGFSQRIYLDEVIEH
jgi:predicted house-cleaning noncanonical NTP pyrophosphatase (MazG superfamily)